MRYRSHFILGWNMEVGRSGSELSVENWPVTDVEMRKSSRCDILTGCTINDEMHDFLSAGEVSMAKGAIQIRHAKQMHIPLLQ